MNQSTNHIMMMEPEGFHENPQTRDTNSYQKRDNESEEAVHQRALKEFRAFRDLLVENGVTVTTVYGRAGSPDDIFCNNWVSTMEGRRMVFYPMLAENRRIERNRDDVIAILNKMYDHVFDLSMYEQDGKFLESTGAMWLDRVNKIAYQGRSRRSFEELAKKWPVWVSDINNLEEALAMIQQIGQLTGKFQQADHLQNQIRSEFRSLIVKDKKPRTAYLIWKEPYMTVGGDSFIHAMMEHAGLDNVFKMQQRYPETNPDELRSLNCEVVLLSSEPYPFREKHIEELQTQLPGTQILLADGEMFSWYGSRLLQAPAYFQKLREMIK